jgi:phage-related protein
LFYSAAIKEGARTVGGNECPEGSWAGGCNFIAKKVYYHVTWSFVFVNAEAKAELDALPADTRASFERIVRLVQAVGLERVHEPYIKHIEDRLWEMRLRGRGGIARALYVTATGRRVVILRVFVKKTQKTPRREIELARQRAKEVT